MTDKIILTRDLPHPPEKVWRALTESAMLADWLMANDFKAEVGHRFTFRMSALPHWNGITDCTVTEVSPTTRLVYSWNSSGAEAATGIQTTVVWTLEPNGQGTRLTLLQSGFRPDQGQASAGAETGWGRFLDKLQSTLSTL